MILKFCFDNEIHRCTRPPTSFAELKPFLSSMFHSGLPSNPLVYYLDSNNGKVFISDEETYQSLFKLDQGNSLKLYIMEQDIISEDTDDDEIIDSVIDSIAHPESPKSSESYESSDDEYEVMSEHPSSQNQILPEKPVEEDQTVQVVHDETPEEVQEIIEIQTVKEVEEESKNEEQGGIERIIMETAESRIYESVKNNYEILQDQETRLMEIVKDTLVKEMPNIVSEVHKKIEEQECIPVQQICTGKKVNKNKNMDSFLASLRNFGLLIKRNFAEIPDATMDILDDLVQFVEGDSNMLYAGRKYPKSVCMKAKQMNEIFPDAHPAHLAEFIKVLPARFTLDQIIDTYINRMMTEEEKNNQLCKQKAC